MPDKWSRPMRISYIVQCLFGRPHHIFSLGALAEELGVARSTVSDDVAILKESFRRTGTGIIETLPGSTGGVRLILRPSPGQMEDITDRLISELEDPARILPGGFLYMTDIIFSPRWAETIGAYFAGVFGPLSPDYVVTIETKGIPPALMTARALDLPLVLIRKNSRVTEGSSVSINYVSGSSSRIQTMSLPRRALQTGSSAVIVDDFMRGGGTVRGACNLLAEFEVRVQGVAVVATTSQPEEKRISEFVTLAEVSFNEQRTEVCVRSKAPPLTI